jgi:molybdopterin-guanine dinucleotide biosynthesis protein B/molybdopterin-guanine dinucleotide biosynthesis protein
MAPGSDDKQVTIGVLLAGGGSRRAGVDKRFLVLEGQTLLRRNLAFLHGLFSTVAVSLGQGQRLDLGDAAQLGETEILYDAWPGCSLAGIATALAHYRAPLFALAVDVAFPSRAAGAQVVAAFPGHDIAVPAIDRHHQPLFAVYGPGCLAPMTAMLEAGEQRIVDVFSKVRVAAVPFESDALFHSVNTLDEYQAARDLARHSKGGSAATVAEDERAGGPDAVSDAAPALVAVVGKSDSGKTTLIEKLVPELVRLGLRVGTVKHDAHSFEIDHPGKDSWRHGQSGAQAYVISSPKRLAYIARVDEEMPLAAIARRYFAGFDLVVAEGYKATAPHRVEIFRRDAGHDAPLCGAGEAMALVTDAPLEHEHLFGLDEARGAAQFLAARLDTLRQY